MTIGNIVTSPRTEWVVEYRQYCNTDVDKSLHHPSHEAAKLSAGKLKLMCSMGSERWDELLCRRAHRGHWTTFVLQCAWYTALHVSHWQTNTNWSIYHKPTCQQVNIFNYKAITWALRLHQSLTVSTTDTAKKIFRMETKDNVTFILL